MSIEALFQDDGTLSPSANTILEALMNLPDDEVSREQYVHIHEYEERRARAVGLRNYQPSRLANAVFDWAAKRMGQFGATGLTALALVELEFAGAERKTLYQASRLAEQVMEKITKQGAGPFRRLVWERDAAEEKQVRAPSSAPDIEKRYREHNAVAHLWGAALALHCQYEHREMLPFNTEADELLGLLRKAVEIEQILIANYPQHFDPKWRIEPYLSDRILSREPSETDPRLKWELREAILKRGLL